MKEKYKNIDLKNEKVQRIIQCALKEFSKNSFKKASTNVIVKNAGISRGLLYHYFTDKEELFEFLINFSNDIVIKGLEEGINWQESDLLERIRQSAKIKVQVSKNYPYLMEFWMNEEHIEAIKRYNNKHLDPSIYQRFYNENIDFNLFREGIDIQMTIKTIVWAIGGLSIEQINRGDVSLDEIIEKIDEYIEYLKQVFYK